MTALTMAAPVLAGVPVWHGTDGPAVVAAGLLGALGAETEVTPGPLRLPGVCVTVDWAGPVRLPLTDEGSVQAACGLMHVHGRRFGRPTPLAVDYCATVAGVLAAQGVLAGWFARLRGAGEVSVRTSVAQAALLALGQYLAAATAHDPDWTQPLLPGGPPFHTEDGVPIEIETLDPVAWQRFWTELGASPAGIATGWRPFVHRFATATCALPAELYRVIGAVPFAAVLAAGRASGVSVVAVATSVLPRVEPCSVVALAGNGNPLADWSGGRPLAGVRVVDAGRRVQGPLAALVLGLLGAEVVRIEPPGGDPQRGMPPMAGDRSARYLALNRGKRVVEVDLKAPAGRQAVLDLVAGAEVFLHNWAPGAAQRYGLTGADLSRANPGLVCAWASGGVDAWVGTDYVVQAHSGVAALLDPARPSPSLVTLTDVLGGLVCAHGVLAGLVARLRTGRGQRVDSSLLSAATVLTHAPHTPRTPPTVPVCTDLAALAADPAFADALTVAECVFPGRPWEFRC